MNEVSRDSTEQLPLRGSELIGAGHADDRVRARARVHEQLFGESEVQEFGRYQLLEAVGRGGMGMVWRARDGKLGREVAIKLLHDGALRRPGPARRQLLAEAALMAKLDHPNVVRVYDVGEHEGELFIAMELVRGKTLRIWQRDRSWGELLDVYRAAGAGLGAAHRANLVHGDFKPDNVLIGDDGRVLVTDFAMTRHVLEARIELELASTNADTPAGESSSDSQTRMTSAIGQPLVRGTPAYMAPEQFDGEIADARTDQFAFCVALWEALAGERPFRGRTWKQLRDAIERGPKTEGSRRGPRSLWAALERGMSVDPRQRWPSLDALLERLAWIQGRTRRWSLAGIGIGLTSLGFAAAIAGMQHEVEPAETIVQQCDPAEASAEIAEIWSADRRSAIEAAFVATELSYAKPSAETTLARLDAWTQAWTEARALACTSSETEDARLSLVCLDRNRGSFAELVSVLGQADANTVDVAPELLDMLPAVETCADFELPVDERARPSSELAKLSELQARVDRIWMLWMVARTDEALALDEPVLREAEALDAKGMIAEVHQQRGLLRLDTGEHDLAVDELLTAALAARKAERPELEAQSWMYIADAESRIGGSGADRWLDIATLPVELADTPELRFDLANNRGLVARAEGRPSEAVAWFEQALGELDESRDSGPDRRLKGLANLGGALVGLDQLERALLLTNEALALAEKHWPPGHPELGILYNSRANIQRGRGQIEAARDDFRRAYDLLSSNFGPDHIYSRTVTYQLALIEADLGHCDEGRRMLDELIPLLRDDPNGAVILPNALAWRALLCNQLQPASRALADEALERAKAVHPEGSLGLAQINAHRAWVLLALEDYAGAEQGFLAAKPALEAELPETHLERAAMLGGLGAALAGQGRDEEARPLLEQGIAGLGDRRPARTAQLQKALAGLSPTPK